MSRGSRMVLSESESESVLLIVAVNANVWSSTSAAEMMGFTVFGSGGGSSRKYQAEGSTWKSDGRAGCA